MSTEALNRIIKEVKALSPDERRVLIDRLAREDEELKQHRASAWNFEGNCEIYGA